MSNDQNPPAKVPRDKGNDYSAEIAATRRSVVEQ